MIRVLLWYRVERVRHFDKDSLIATDTDFIQLKIDEVFDGGVICNCTLP